jgi:hypothetical protein
MVVPSALLASIPQLQLLQLRINHLLMVQLSSQSLPCPWLHRLTALLHTTTLRLILVTIPTLAVQPTTPLLRALLQLLAALLPLNPTTDMAILVTSILLKLTGA